MTIKIWNEDAFKGMEKAGQLARKCLDFIEPFVKEGVNTLYLNDLIEKYIRDNGAIPAPLNYHGFPKATCISLNNVICHGIPSQETILQKGDILNIDVTVILDGWYGDTSRMYTIEPISIRSRRLVDITKLALDEAINIVKPGVKLYEVGRVIEDIVAPYKFSVVKDFCGHGIGREFHTEPSVLHYESKYLNDIELKEGMFLTIEPMINAGSDRAKILKDGWTATTVDRKNSAQFEHTIGVTAEGCQIFTK